MIITKNDKMGNAILHDQKLLTVLHRFDIKLGFGDKTIAEICELNNINTDFFLEIANAFHDVNYFTENKMKSFSLKLIISYLRKSHELYLETKIPTIGKLINSLDYKTSEQKNILIIKKFFNDYKIELSHHIKQEEDTIYPYIIELEDGLKTKKVKTDFFDRMINYSAYHYKEEHESIDEKLYDLKNIIIKYLPPPKNHEICNVILNKLFRLEEDMTNHSKIENSVMLPIAIKMEKEIKALNDQNKIKIF